MVQPNVQARKKAAKKNNAAAPAPAAVAAPSVQQVMAVVVPEEIYALMKQALGNLPRNETDLLFTTMQGLRPQMVTMQLPPGMPPQG